MVLVVCLRSDPIVCRFPHRHAITQETWYFGTWYFVHDSFYVRGECLLKYSTSPCCETTKNWPSLKARKIISAMMLITPVNWCRIMIDAWAWWMRSPRNCNRYPVIWDLGVRNYYAHATVIMLSHNVARWVYVSGRPFAPRSRKPSSAPANSKSLIVIFLFGFSAVTRLSWISCGH